MNIKDMLTAHDNNSVKPLSLNNSVKSMLRGGDRNIIPGGVILLPRVFNDGDKLDWNKFEEIIEASVRYLDSLIDMYGLEHKKIMLGVSGLADLFINLKIRYGSRESIILITNIMTILKTKAYETSILMNRELGNGRSEHVDDNILNVLPLSIKHNYKKFGIKHSSLIGLDATDISDDTYSRGISPILYKAYKTKDGRYYISSTFKMFLMRRLKEDWCVDVGDVDIEEYLNIYSIVKKYSDDLMIDYLPQDKLTNIDLKFYVRELGCIKILHTDSDIIRIPDGEALEYTVSMLMEKIIRAEDLGCGACDKTKTDIATAG